MPAPLDGLTPAQQRAATHPAGPLADRRRRRAAGKTRALIARFARLVADGTPPEAITVLTFSEPAAAELRARVEATIEGAYEELTVTTFHGLCARLLGREPGAGGLDAFVEPVSVADRLALLLEHIDELALRHHDLQGNPAGLLASFIDRFDRLKAELVTAEDYARWADGLRRRRPRRSRARVRGHLPGARTDSGPSAERWTTATWCCAPTAC